MMAGRYALCSPDGAVPEPLCRALDARAALSLRAPVPQQQAKYRTLGND